LIISFFPTLVISASGDDIEHNYQLMLDQVVDVQSQIQYFHPFLEKLYPIAIVADGHFYIFDIDSFTNRYQFIKKAPLPNPLPENIAASFPLQAFDARPSCVLGEKILERVDFFVTTFHEFMHCAQMSAGEQDIKSGLGIYQKAMSVNDYMWEINHPFPYADSVFVSTYDTFLSALEQGNSELIQKCRARLAVYLSSIDYEYMCWQEWKEGFARKIENDIRQHFQLEINNTGCFAPFDRIVFYYGGEQFIRFLELKVPSINRSVKDLFAIIQSPEEIR
jgi:hypothetical protein